MACSTKKDQVVDGFGSAELMVDNVTAFVERCELFSMSSGVIPKTTAIARWFADVALVEIPERKVSLFAQPVLVNPFHSRHGLAFPCRTHDSSFTALSGFVGGVSVISVFGFLR